MSNLEARLAEIFRVILDIDDAYDVHLLRKLDERKWDSLAHVSLMVAIESEFGIRIKVSDMNQVASFNAALIMLESSIL